MENQQLATSNSSNALDYIKIMNKLGASFFIMFLVGAILPLVDSGGFSTETISLYNLAEPMLLMLLATVGVLVYLSGISRTAGRIVSLVFIALIIIPSLSQLYDAYDVFKTTSEMYGDTTVDFDDFGRHVVGMAEALAIQRNGQNALSLALVLLVVSFCGIVGGIFSPRYKENKQLKAAITGQQVEITESDTSADTKSNNVNEAALLVKAKTLVNSLIKKVIAMTKYAYQITKPLVNSLLDKGTDIICKQQPQLKREQVKMVLGGILVVLIYLVVF
jgi:hypothetical protein